MLLRPTLVGLTVLLLAACGGATAESTVSDGKATTEVASEAPEPAGTGTAEAADTAEAAEVLQFVAPLVGGGELDFRQFAGATVALWFWAPT